MKLAFLHQAARIIEQEGVQGFTRAEGICGREQAWALLIAHLRHGAGSYDFGCGRSPDEVIGKVDNELLKARMLTD